MRAFVFFAAFLFLFSFAAFPASAAEKTYSYDGTDLPLDTDIGKALENALPEEIMGLELPTEDELATGELQGTDGKFLLKKVVEAVKNEFSSPVSLFFTLSSLVAAASVFKALSSAVRSTGVAAAFSLCSSLCFGMALISPLLRLISRTRVFLEVLNSFLLGLLPVFTSLFYAGGSIACAAYANSGAYMLTVIVEEVFLKILLPLCKLIFAVGLVASLSSVDLSGVTKVLKDSFTTVIAFFMMLHSAVFALGNQVAAAKDGIALRAVRFAAGSFIPVVGGAVSEAMRTVAGSLTLIKTGVGWVSCVAVVLLLLPPLVSALLHRTAIELSAAVARICSLSFEAKLLDAAVTVCNLLCALMAAASVLFVLAVTVFIKTAVAL